jgi:hypothetical protein
MDLEREAGLGEQFTAARRGRGKDKHTGDYCKGRKQRENREQGLGTRDQGIAALRDY